jgi:hypothetical protein
MTMERGPLQWTKSVKFTKSNMTRDEAVAMGELTLDQIQHVRGRKCAEGSEDPDSKWIVAVEKLRSGFNPTF